MFSNVVNSYWIPESVDYHDGDGVLVAVDPLLTKNRAVSLLHVKNGPSVLSLSTEQAAGLGLSDQARISTVELSARLSQSGISLNDPDHLFYLSVSEQATLRDENHSSDTRQLTDFDAAAFAVLTASSPENDLEEAFVELDHWLVFGTFIDGRLVSAASMYPWSGTQLADLGVITLPEFRGRGLGRATVRAMSAEAIGNGYEPQYRCQLDNAASVALARAAGFSCFGEWEVIDHDD